MTPTHDQVGFAPEDPLDGRQALDWKSKYTEPICKRWIGLEASYLILLFILIQITLCLIWLETPKTVLGIEESKYALFSRYAYGWLGGAFGGILFSMKWLYHSVAKRIWHLDRRLWRFFTPLISGGMGFTFLILIKSSLFNFFAPSSTNAPSACFVVGFLVGYFSDSALGKLSEIAQTFFGSNRPTTRKRTQTDSSAEDKPTSEG